MVDPLADQERAAAREWGEQVARVWVTLRRRRVPVWLAARLTLAYATGESREPSHVTVVTDE